MQNQTDKITTTPMKIAFFLMGLLALWAFSFQVGKGWYEHNDGVTIACSQAPVAKLIHPGEQSVLGCTYDHQPIYMLFVKAIGPLVNFDLKVFQIFNVCFLLIGFLILARALKEKIHYSLALSLPFFFLTSFSTLYWIQELRMFTLFLGTTAALFGYFYEARYQSKVRSESYFIHFIGYFNYFMYAFPLGAYLLYHFSLWRKWNKKLIVLAVLFFIFVLIKLPYIFFWRVQSRSGGQDLGFSHIKLVFIDGLFKGTTLYMVVAWIVLVFAILSHLRIIKKNLHSRWYLGIIFLSYAFVVFCTVIMQMHEIELRYLLYLYPLFALISAEALDRLGTKVKIAISIILVSVGFYNASQMYTRGVVGGGEIKKSSEAFSKFTADGIKVYTDDPYFTYNYVGVYSFVETNKLRELHYFGKDSQDLLTEEKEILYITVLRSEEEHRQLLERLPGNKERLWSENNLLGFKTIMTRVSFPNKN